MRAMMYGRAHMLDWRSGLRAWHIGDRGFIRGMNDEAGVPKPGLFRFRRRRGVMARVRGYLVMRSGSGVSGYRVMMAMVRMGARPGFRNTGGRNASHDDGQNDADT
jgi:hypothetical protein